MTEALNIEALIGAACAENAAPESDDVTKLVETLAAEEKRQRAAKRRAEFLAAAKRSSRVTTPSEPTKL